MYVLRGSEVHAEGRGLGYSTRVRRVLTAGIGGVVVDNPPSEPAVNWECCAGFSGDWSLILLNYGVVLERGTRGPPR